MSRKLAARKEADIIEIKRLLVLGKTHQEIMEEVHLSHATFYRYLKELSKREKYEMLHRQDKGIAAAITFTKERLLNTYRNLRSIADDEQIRPKYRIRAEHGILDVVLSILRLEAEQYSIVKYNKDLLSIGRHIEQTLNSIEKPV